MLNQDDDSRLYHLRERQKSLESDLIDLFREVDSFEFGEDAPLSASIVKHDQSRWASSAFTSDTFREWLVVEAMSRRLRAREAPQGSIDTPTNYQVSASRDSARTERSNFDDGDVNPKKKHRGRTIVSEPFSFELREACKQRPISKIRLEEELAKLKTFDEDASLYEFHPRPVPATNVPGLYARLEKSEKERKERFRRNRRSLAPESFQLEDANRTLEVDPKSPPKTCKRSKVIQELEAQEAYLELVRNFKAHKVPRGVVEDRWLSIKEDEHSARVNREFRAGELLKYYRACRHLQGVEEREKKWALRCSTELGDQHIFPFAPKINPYTRDPQAPRSSKKEPQPIDSPRPIASHEKRSFEDLYRSLTSTSRTRSKTPTGDLSSTLREVLTHHNTVSNQRRALHNKSLEISQKARAAQADAERKQRKLKRAEVALRALELQPQPIETQDNASDNHPPGIHDGSPVQQ